MADEPALSREEKKTLYHLLHLLWGKGKDGPDYVKQEWKDFHVLLDKAGVLPRG